MLLFVSLLFSAKDQIQALSMQDIYSISNSHLGFKILNVYIWRGGCNVTNTTHTTIADYNPLSTLHIYSPMFLFFGNLSFVVRV